MCELESESSSQLGDDDDLFGESSADGFSNTNMSGSDVPISELSGSELVDEASYQWEIQGGWLRLPSEISSVSSSELVGGAGENEFDFEAGSESAGHEDLEAALDRAAVAEDATSSV